MYVWMNMFTCYCGWKVKLIKKQQAQQSSLQSYKYMLFYWIIFHNKISPFNACRSYCRNVHRSDGKQAERVNQGLVSEDTERESSLMSQSTKTQSMLWKEWNQTPMSVLRTNRLQLVPFVAGLRSLHIAGLPCLFARWSEKSQHSSRLLWLSFLSLTWVYIPRNTGDVPEDFGLTLHRGPLLCMACIFVIFTILMFVFISEDRHTLVIRKRRRAKTRLTDLSGRLAWP